MRTFRCLLAPLRGALCALALALPAGSPAAALPMTFDPVASLSPREPLRERSVFATPEALAETPRDGDVGRARGSLLLASIHEVPEPSTALLITAGLSLLAICGRRREPRTGAAAASPGLRRSASLRLDRGLAAWRRYPARPAAVRSSPKERSVASTRSWRSGTRSQSAEKPHDSAVL